MKTKFNKTAKALAILTVLLLPAAGGNAADTDTRLVSVNSAGTDSGNSGSYDPVLSANGRFVAFLSSASDLVANDTNGTDDVFVRDLRAGTTTLASINSAGTASGNSTSGNSLSGSPVMSANGRFVAFLSSASDLVANDTNGTDDVFVRDLKTGTTTLVSVNNAGMASGNSLSEYPVISANGRFVAFVSYASDLVANDTNGTADVFVRDLKTKTTTLVSLNSAGTASGNSYSFDKPMLNADGRFVAFVSYASDLVANDTNGTLGDVFVRDLKAGTTTLVSVNRAGTASGTDISTNPMLSSNGRFVAFSSYANDLVANDTNETTDTFVRDLKTGITTLVSVNNAGTDSANNRSGIPNMSADGRFVAFTSEATDLVANINFPVQGFYVRDLKTGTTTLASVNIAGTATRSTRSYGVISADGRFVAFESNANDLVANDDFPSQYDTFIRDLKTGTTTRLASKNSDVTAFGYAPVLSANGRFVAFISFDSDLVANDTNSAFDIFVRPTR